MTDDEWEPRIGREAAQTLQTATQYVRYAFMGGMVVVGVAFAALLSRSMPPWFSILGSVAILIWLFAMILASCTFSLRRRRAARQAYEYLGRPPQCHKERVLPFVLRDPEVFDNYLAERGIPPRGSYASLASPKAIAKGTRAQPRPENPHGISQ